MKTPAILLSALSLTAGFLPAQTSTTVPLLVNYQGRVTDGNNAPLGSTGTAPNFTAAPINRKVIFRIFDASSGGNRLWSEQQTATISLGEFSVLLGQGTQAVYNGNTESRPDLDTAFTSGGAAVGGPARYLEIVVDNGDGTFTGADTPIVPRQRINSSPYAFRARMADTVPDNAITTNALATGSITAGKIADNVITSDKIINGSISTADLADSSVSALKLASDIGVWTASGGNVFRTTGNVGIQTGIANFPISMGESAGEKISLWGNSPADVMGFGIQAAELQIHGALPGHKISFGYGPSATMTRVMVIQGDGNVGIGTTNPQRRLRVSGPSATANLDLTYPAGFGSGNRQLILGYDDTLDCGVINASDAGVAWKSIAIAPVGGNVGIGTTAPGAKLQVEGGIRARGGAPGAGGGNNNGFAFWGNNGDPDSGMFSDGDGTLLFFSNAGERMRIHNNGFVGIGTTSPAVMLDVAGSGILTMTAANGIDTLNSSQGAVDIGLNTLNTSVGIRSNSYIVSSVGFLAYSDRRIKQGLCASDPAKDLEAISKLRVTDYRMVDPADGGNAWHRGFIAQEVEEVIPKAVKRGVDFVPDIFAEASTIVHDASHQTLSITLGKEHNLKVRDRVRLHMDGKRFDLEVSAVPSVRKFVVGNCEQAPEKVFVYGRQVDDFRSLDYDALFTTGISAIQELARKVDALEARQKALTALEAKLAKAEAQEKENAELKTKLEKQEGRLTAIEQLLTDKTSSAGRKVSLKTSAK